MLSRLKLFFISSILLFSLTIEASKEVYEAICRQDFQEALDLVLKGAVDVEFKTKKGTLLHTTLLYAVGTDKAIQPLINELLVQLIVAGVDPNECDKNKSQPLYLAVMSLKDCKKIELLLQFDASMQALSNFDFNNPLNCALRSLILDLPDREMALFKQIADLLFCYTPSNWQEYVFECVIQHSSLAQLFPEEKLAAYKQKLSENKEKIKLRNLLKEGYRENSKAAETTCRQLYNRTDIDQAAIETTYAFNKTASKIGTVKTLQNFQIKGHKPGSLITAKDSRPLESIISEMHTTIREEKNLKSLN